MNLTEQQRALYAAIGAGKEVRYRHPVSGALRLYMGDGTEPTLGNLAYEWIIIDPDTITVSYTIPKPLTVVPEVGCVYALFSDGGVAKFRPVEIKTFSLFNVFKTREDAEAAHTARTSAYKRALGV
jgi:hypothetical protein